MASPVAAQATEKKFSNISDDEDEDEVPAATPEGENACEVEPEDTHDAMKIVLQRQFFEAITRAASVKFASGIGCEDLPNLALKLNHLFENNMKPLAVKNRSKSVEQVKEWRLAEKVFDSDDYDESLLEVFRYFSSKEGNTSGGRKDETLTFQELLDMLRRAKLLQEVGSTPVQSPISIDDGEGPVLPAEISTKAVIFAVERYYDPKDTLAAKVCDEEFEKYLAANPMLLRVNQEAEEKRLQEEEKKREEQAKADAGEGSGAEAAEASQEQEEGGAEDPLSEGALNARAEAERQEIRAAWEKQLISAHLVYIKGVELVFYEFKELLLELANQIAHNTQTFVAGKPRTMLKRFLDEHFLKRLIPYIRYYRNKAAEENGTQGAAGAKRTWPESEKDRKIREFKEEQKRREAELQAKKEEEAANNADNDGNELSADQEEARRAEEEARLAAEEEARKAAEAEAKRKADEDEEDDDEKSLDDDYYDEDDESGN